MIGLPKFILLDRKNLKNELIFRFLKHNLNFCLSEAVLTRVEQNSIIVAEKIILNLNRIQNPLVSFKFLLFLPNE